MSNQSKLAPYLPMAAFLSAVCGDNFEVILHDVSEPETSVVAIFNGHLSGRKVGDPMTELARSLVREEVYREQDFVSNYEGRTRDGKQFVSSTYFINNLFAQKLCELYPNSLGDRISLASQSAVTADKVEPKSWFKKLFVVLNRFLKADV